MHRRSFALLFAPAPCSLLSAEAQQPTKVRRIGFLGARPSSSSPGTNYSGESFVILGYVEGKNIAFEYRYAENKLDRLPALADELVRLKVDVLVTTRRPLAALPRTLPGRSPSFFMA